MQTSPLPKLNIGGTDTNTTGTRNTTENTANTAVNGKENTKSSGGGNGFKRFIYLDWYFETKNQFFIVLLTNVQWVFFFLHLFVFTRQTNLDI